MSIPDNTIFSMVMTASFGNISTQAQNDLWEQFLVSNGIDPNSVDLTTVTLSNPNLSTQQLQIATDFTQFVQKAYATSTGLAQLSPEDAAKRLLLGEVFQLLIKMMQHITYTAQVLGNNVTFQNKLRDQYARMEGREANNFYIAGANVDPSIPASITTAKDLSNWTLGYARINMGEYIDSAVAGTFTNIDGVDYTQDPANEHASNTIGYPPLTITSDKLEITDPDNNTQSVDQRNSFTFQGSPTGVTGTFTGYAISLTAVDSGFGIVYTPVVTPVSAPQFSYTYQPQDDTVEKQQAAVKAAFIQYLQQNPTVSSSLTSTTNPFRIQWNKEYNLQTTADASKEDSVYQSGAAGERAQKNTLLQQYITNTQSRMQILTNLADGEQSSIQQSQTGINSMANIIQSTIGNLSTMLTSIFQVAT